MAIPLPRPAWHSWFQIHLSTALVLMLEASVILGLNLRTSSGENFSNYTCVERLPSTYRSIPKGWPYTCWVESISPENIHDAQWFDLSVKCNLFVGLVILLGTSIPMELVLRRLERNRKDRLAVSSASL